MPLPSDPAARAPEPARSFGRVAREYEAGRPTYPAEAISWLVGSEPLSILELGAGTGKLTDVLLGLGHEVFATDPDDAMLDILSAKFPDIRSTSGTAEQIPAGDGLYDAVVVGQAFHWFDLDAALPEIVRVLRPRGVLAVVRNERDTRIPWVRKLGAILGQVDEHDDPVPELDTSALFSAVETREFRHWQTIDRDSVQSLALSRSNVASLDAEGREAKRADVLAFYDDYGRGMDGMQLPYVCRGFRTTVLPHAYPKQSSIQIDPPADPLPALSDADDSEALLRSTARSDTADTADRLPRVLRPEDDGDTGTILIDFH